MTNVFSQPSQNAKIFISEFTWFAEVSRDNSVCYHNYESTEFLLFYFIFWVGGIEIKVKTVKCKSYPLY